MNILSEEEIFTAAVALPLSERAAYLDGACAGSAALRSQVDALLAAHDQPDSLLASPAFDVTIATAVDADGPGAQIGPYKLLEQIGEGGMGIVYMAQQSYPVKRRVALKLIKPGMDTREVIARFEAERQALAMMEHPNIARIIDAGVVGEGIGNRGSGSGKTEGHRGDAPPTPIPDSRSLNPAACPYFVMELVRGLPITDYCDQARLSPDQRLELFVTVCQAVQHAHQKGIIHRDLKPSNILVTLHDGAPVPKVIDFGVAKAINQQLGQKSLFTAFAQVLGTPLYMSPEQAEISGLDIDTRSDVYSLGVLLYELLTGQTPFDRETVKHAGLDELRRMIREDEPARPSQRISTLDAQAITTAADQRGVDQRRLRQLLQGELDWIVMKALEKDRNRRYESASAFAADVRRYLTDEPVQACPPSPVYRLRKFTRRYQASLATAAIVVVALLAGTAVATWKAVEARQSLVQAVHATMLANERLAEVEHQRKQSQASERRAIESALQAANAAKAESKAKQAETAQRKLAEAAAGDTRAFANFLVDHVLAAPRPEGVDSGQGINITVAAAIEAAEPNISKVFAGRPKAEATARFAIGNTLLQLGAYARAEAHLRQALTLRKKHLGEEAGASLEAAGSLAVCLDNLGRSGEAILIDEEVLKLRKVKLGLHHEDTLKSLANLAAAHRHAGNLDQALALMEESLELHRSHLGPDNESTLMAMNNLAAAYWDARRIDEALPLFEQASRLHKAKLGPEHPQTLTFMSNLGTIYGAAGKQDLALPLLEETFELQKAKLGPGHPDTVQTMINLGLEYRNTEAFEQAIALGQEAMKLSTAKLGRDHPLTFTSMDALAGTYKTMKQPDQALTLHEEVFELKKSKLGSRHPGTLETMAEMGKIWLERREFSVAEPLLRQSLIASEEIQPDVWTTFERKSLLGAVLVRQSSELKASDPAAAEKMLAEAEPLLLDGYHGLKARETKLPIKCKAICLKRALERLVELYTALDKPDEAAKWQALLPPPADAAPAPH